MTKAKVDLEALWETVLARLKDELPARTYEGYLKQVTLQRIEGSQIFATVPAKFVKDGLDEKGITPQVLQALQKAIGRPVEFFVTIQAPVKTAPEGHPKGGTEPAAAAPVAPSRGNLNAKYRLESYIVGPSNRFAHAASLAVTKSPGEVYNPLFIYGPVGVGKTHLMQGVGHKILDNKPDMKVVYVTAEVFTSECIDAIRDQSTQKFQKKYRTVDVLLIDDVQFFEQTQHMQETFFHAFNELYQKRKQIVLTSDRPPKHLNKLQERLVNRFESGLTADVKPPDLETREAILLELGDRAGVVIPPEALQFLAGRCASNVRELEGSFNRVAASASLTGQTITVDLVRSVLDELRGKDKKREPSEDSITGIVAEHFGLKAADLLSRRQERRVVLPRQVAMLLIHELGSRTLKQVASYFGKKDHTTVMHALNKIEAALETDPQLADDVTSLRQRVKELLG